MMNSDYTRVRIDGIMFEGDFIYTKFSKPVALMSLLFGDKNSFINILLDIKKLSVLVTYILK